MKLAFIVLISLAVVLGFITYFALFSGPQYVQPAETAQNTQVAPISIQPAASTTSSSMSAFIGGTSSNVGASGIGIDNASASPVYQTMFSAPYPITWSEGEPQLSIMGATLQANQLILSVNIQMGQTAQCVPVNLRLITDEEGDMQAPDAPASPNFPLAPDGTCQGDSETAYSESVTFTINASTSMPFLLSTGDPANGFFEIATTTGNGLQVDVPQKNG